MTHVSSRIISVNGYIYLLLSLSGAAGIVVIPIAKKATQPAVLIASAQLILSPT